MDGRGRGAGAGGRGITGSRREIQDKVIELAPPNLTDKLRDRLGYHGGAPDYGLVLVDQEPHGHDLHAELFGWNQHALLSLGACSKPQHDRDTGSANIGVEKSNAESLLRKAKARLTATVVFPTPPYPLATAMKRLTCPLPRKGQTPRGFFVRF